uniref:C2H2-type domain-containing protein n=1 Tax=Coccidioides posadasii RMSCC 3488 TaxID=454284 RepID=A0A0J6FS72_COCPO|nr:hypothetical protein CPAG_08572 [Coccidioides posadasii RMSCC 3488]
METICECVPCHFCGKKYTSASSVTHHLELGSCRCAKGVNHTSILHAIQQRDPHHIITDKQIEWYKEDVSKYLATDLAYNGFFWECYLCHAEFGTKGALNAHINSPAHSQRISAHENLLATPKCTNMIDPADIYAILLLAEQPSHQASAASTDTLLHCSITLALIGLREEIQRLRQENEQLHKENQQLRQENKQLDYSLDLLCSRMPSGNPVPPEEHS